MKHKYNTPRLPKCDCGRIFLVATQSNHGQTPVLDPEVLQLLNSLKAWHDLMGGFESPVWRHLEQYLIKVQTQGAHP